MFKTSSLFSLDFFDFHAVPQELLDATEDAVLPSSSSRFCALVAMLVRAGNAWCGCGCGQVERRWGRECQTHTQVMPCEAVADSKANPRERARA